MCSDVIRLEAFDAYITLLICSLLHVQKEFVCSVVFWPFKVAVSGLSHMFAEESS